MCAVKRGLTVLWKYWHQALQVPYIILIILTVARCLASFGRGERSRMVSAIMAGKTALLIRRGHMPVMVTSWSP